MLVEVVFAGAGQPIRREVAISEGGTVMQAIEASGLMSVLAAGSVDPARLGVFSRRVPPDHVLQAGDRVEIYRPLMLDPMEARRRRAS